LLGFILILVGLDFGVGKILELAYYSQTSGKFYRTTAIVDRTTADVLIFGSSRAIHHYDSRVFESELGMSTFNAGSRGQDMIYTYAILKSALKRYTPKLVILNIDTRLFNLEGKFERLADLAPYYRSHEELRTIIERRSKFENVKLLSTVYQYNSTLLHIINYALFPQIDYDGFFPLKGVAEIKGVNLLPVNGDLLVDNDYLFYYQSFLDDCQKAGVQIIVTLSPSLIATAKEPQAMQVAMENAKTRNIPIMDYSQDQRFINHSEFYADTAHLNESGAQFFSRIFINDLISNQMVHDNKLSAEINK
jgi:hypothetical protein